MPAKLSHFTYNDVTLARAIARLAADSSRVVLTTHAKRRMKERGILLTQVLECLKSGTVDEPAHQDIHGSWKCTLGKVIAGDHVRVAAALETR